MSDKWAVVVVHGVGETGPGTTVDSLLSSLAAENSNLRPTGAPEVRLLPDPADRKKPLLSFFPMHVRRARVTNPVPGQPKQAIFAECYWADLSNIHDGVWHLLLGIFSAIFLLGFVADATFMRSKGTEYKAKWCANWLGRWLRFLLYVASWSIYGPVAALTALLGFILVMHYVVLQRLPALVTSGDRGVGIIVALALVIGGYSSWRALDKNWGTTWARFWFAFLGTSLVAGLVVLAHAVVSCYLPRSQAWSWFTGQVPVWLGFQGTVPDGVCTYAAITLLGIRGVFIGQGAVMLAALVLMLLAWGWAAWVVGDSRAGPCLAVAFCAVVVQIGLWLFLIIPLAMILVASLPASGGGRPESELDFLSIEWKQFMLQLVLVVAFSVLAACVWGWRRLRVQRGKAVPRLIVHPFLLWTLVILYGAGVLLFLANASEYFAFPSLLNDVRALVVGAIPLAATLLSKDLRAGLHIIMDVVNHFYRERKKTPIPWPWRQHALDPVPVEDFATQQYIEKRFELVLTEIRKEPGITHLSIVCHSQGTVIAVDVLCKRLTRTMGKWLRDLREFHLVTMGSPLSNLYQHYFPGRYPPFGDPGWQRLPKNIWAKFYKLPLGKAPPLGVKRRWVNIYRRDDYVGTMITPAHAWPPLGAGRPISFDEQPIAPGGHTDYWEQPEVIDILRGELPG